MGCSLIFIVAACAMTAMGSMPAMHEQVHATAQKQEPCSEDEIAGDVSPVLIQKQEPNGCGEGNDRPPIPAPFGLVLVVTGMVVIVHCTKPSCCVLLAA
ncbi:hypothetical protein HY30_08340 [Hyphomonas chukchiensis]|uniref:Uncharacterized protein n=1 Tax=Hyphomonas chukchiensis TaxID=1280947 RepID=A0A062UA67_9PROT|nr:hypothetical protein HY30_08340 [Hyphomonas chukchiensis]